MVFGKNTMIRKCIRNLTADGAHPEWESIIPVMKGNLGFVFTNNDLEEVIELLKQFVKPAAAKAGVVAPCSCTINKGPTGLDPAQTSFFQALNIPTKINNKPFEYGLVVHYIYEGGVFDPSVLKITDQVLMDKWMTAVGQVAALSIGADFLTEASVPILIASAFKNVVAVALEADFIEFEQVQKVKDFLDDPDAFLASVPSGGGGGAAEAGATAPVEAAKAPEPEPEPEEEEEEEMGFDLFD